MHRSSVVPNEMASAANFFLDHDYRASNTQPKVHEYIVRTNTKNPAQKIEKSEAQPSHHHFSDPKQLQQPQQNIIPIPPISTFQRSSKSSTNGPQANDVTYLKASGMYFYKKNYGDMKKFRRKF